MYLFQPSVLALSIIALEIQAQKCIELTEGVECLQKHSKVCQGHKLNPIAAQRTEPLVLSREEK